MDIGRASNRFRSRKYSIYAMKMEPSVYSAKSDIFAKERNINPSKRVQLE